MELSVQEGEVLGLIGPNGSGKTTLINVVTGVYRPDAGSIRMRGREIVGMKTYQISRLGINRTYQTPKPLSSLTVEQNIRLAALYGNGKRSALPGGVEEVMKITGLHELRDKPSLSLNSFHRKMLDLGRALATDPEVILIDELAAGLNQSELRDVAQLLSSIRERGISLVVVEHIMEFIKSIANRVVVLSYGKKIFEGSFHDAANDPAVKEVYLGRGSSAES